MTHDLEPMTQAWVPTAIKHSLSPREKETLN